MSPPTSKTAESIAGYTIQERIGAGGYGEVWRAEAPGGLHKAIKFVYGYLDEERAARELKALNRIKEVRHPFLLSLDRIEVVDCQLVIVTELAESSLKDRFQQCRESDQPGIPRDELLVYLRDAADALDYMSANYSLQHLDVKPENLLIVGGRVKVADFGLVKDIHDTSMSLMGGLTPLYSPPEVFDGRPSLHSDQYSLAIVYHEMLTGVLPFPGRTASQLAAQHLHSRPRLASLPPSDRAVIARALSKDPEKRFPSCRVMIESLLKAGDASRDKSVEDDDWSAESDSASDTTSVASKATEPADQPEPPSPSCSDPIRSSPSVTKTLDFDAVSSSVGSPEEESDTATSFESGTSPREGQSAGPEPEPHWLSPPAPAEVRELAPIEAQPEEYGLRPTLVLGIGGTAARTLRRLRRRLHDRFGSLASVPSVRILLLETDLKTIAEATRTGEADGLEPDETISMPLRPPQQYRSQSKDLMQWLSRRWLYNIPRSLRTEGLRPLGRLAFVDHAPELFERLRDLLASITSPESLADSSKNTGLRVLSNVPRVFVVASISGGTGSGMVLDVGYAVRKALADLGLSSEDVCGILTHSGGRNPRDTDLANANAYACLSELQHYSNTRHYPGDPACGLPAFPEGTPPFDHTYLLPLGSSLDKADLDAALDSLTEYLYLSGVTTGSALLDQCRHASDLHDHATTSQVSLRTFALSRLGYTVGDFPSKAAESLCQSVIQRWRGEPESELRNAKPAESPAGQPDGPADAPLTNEAIAELASQRAAELQLGLDRLIERIVALVGRQLGDDPSVRLGNLVAEVLSDGEPARRGAAGAPRAGQALEAIDHLLGPRDAAEDPPDASPDSLRSALETPVEGLRRELKQAVTRWILELANSSQGRVKGAQYAAGWFAQHLRSLESEARDLLEHFDKQLPQWEQALLNSGPGGGARRKRWFGIGRRAKDDSDSTKRWAEYCRLRLCRLALLFVPRLVRSLHSQVALVGDRVGQLQRELRLISDGFRVPPSWNEAPKSEDPRRDTFDRFRRSVADRLRRQMPEMARRLDEQFRSEFFGEEGLWELLRDERDVRRPVQAALRRSARRVVLDALRQIDVARLLAPSPGPQEADPWLHAGPDSATPRLSACGGAKRLLLVLPEGTACAQLQDAVNEHLATAPSVVLDSDFDVVFCWEMEQLPLDRAAATLIDYRVDYARLASRLHTRVDVSWTPLADSGAR